MFLRPEQIGDLIQSYAKDAMALKEQVVDICYAMKGGIEYDSAWAMSFEDRETAVRVMNRRIKEENPGGPEYM